MAEGEGRRISPRDSLFLHATLRGPGSDVPVTTRVRNLSAGGMMAEVGHPFAEGDAVEVWLRGVGTLAGTVAWRIENRIGIAFESSIDPLSARKSVGSGRPTVAETPPLPPRSVKRPKLFG